jgi:hypothetical protein
VKEHAQRDALVRIRADSDQVAHAFVTERMRGSHPDYQKEATEELSELLTAAWQEGCVAGAVIAASASKTSTAETGSNQGGDDMRATGESPDEVEGRKTRVASNRSEEKASEAGKDVSTESHGGSNVGVFMDALAGGPAVEGSGSPRGSREGVEPEGACDPPRTSEARPFITSVCSAGDAHEQCLSIRCECSCHPENRPNESQPDSEHIASGSLSSHEARTPDHAAIGAGGGDDEGYIHPDVLATQSPEFQQEHAARASVSCWSCTTVGGVHAPDCQAQRPPDGWSNVWECESCGKRWETTRPEGQWCANGHPAKLVSKRLRMSEIGPPYLDHCPRHPSPEDCGCPPTSAPRTSATSAPKHGYSLSEGVPMARTPEARSMIHRLDMLCPRCGQRWGVHPERGEAGVYCSEPLRRDADAHPPWHACGCLDSTHHELSVENARLRAALREANEMVCKFHMPYGWSDFQTRNGLPTASEVRAEASGVKRGGT